MSECEKKAVVQVLGCKVNQAEAAAMTGLLQSRGYVVDPAAQEPDLVLVNTCCVTSKAEAKSRRMANRLAQKYPSALVVVTGCLAEVNPWSIQEDMDRVVVLGTFEKDRFAEFLENRDITAHRDKIRSRTHQGEGSQSDTGSGRVHHTGSSACTSFVDQGCSGIPGRGRIFLKVQDGCSQRCSYCIVPSSRGPSRSLAADAVCAHARTLEGQGFAEIVLTGIHLGWYGRDLTPAIGLQDLLERLLEECPTVRFRLSSVEPPEITPRLIELAATHPRVCRHFHIPLQSGDDDILRRMGRPYRTGFMQRLWESTFRAIPDACVGLDIMVGFPGESEQSFLNTLSLIQASGVAYLHVFPFSPRTGTPAAGFFPRVAERTARARVEELRSLSAAMRERYYRRFLGRTLVAVSETAPDSQTRMVKARTDNYIPVNVCLPPELMDRTSFSVTLTGIERGEVSAEVSQAEPIL
jgi:threonylcarbamoyladenosine tRNA methylthiotransferase MtaB